MGMATCSARSQDAFEQTMFVGCLTRRTRRRRALIDIFLQSIGLGEITLYRTIIYNNV